MGKSAHNDVLDAVGDYLAANATRMTLCSAEPTTYAEANATYSLAQVTIDASDFTNSDGDVSGRKTTVASQASVDVDVTGVGTHLALLDVANSKLLYVTTCTSVAVDSAGTVNLSAFDIETRDPA